MSNSIQLSGAYLASRLGASNASSSTDAGRVTLTEVGKSLLSPSQPGLQLSPVSGKSYLMLKDTVDRWSSMVSLVQVADADLDTISNYLAQIKTAQIQLDSWNQGSAEFAAIKESITQIEAGLSNFLGSRTVETPDVLLVKSEQGLFTEEAFQTLDTDSSGPNSMAVLEVDMGKLLTKAHDSSHCPICNALNVSLSEDGIKASDGPVQNSTSAAGSLATSVSATSFIETLRMSSKWDLAAGESLSYSYYDGDAVPYVGYPAGARNPPATVSAISAANTVGIDAAFALWDELTGLSFDKVNESGTTVGELRVAYTSDIAAGSAAYAYNPGNLPVSGDIWFGVNVQTNYDFSVGSYGFLSALHEIGHSIGLSHPFDGGSATGATLGANEDFLRNTIMSYTSKDRNYYLQDSGNNVSLVPIYASTAMRYDIATAEYFYGASTTTRATNTVYSWAVNPKILETVLDSGGADTFDLSNQTKSNKIDLRPGAFSSIGIWNRADQISYYNGLGYNISNYLTAADATVTAPSQSILYTGEDNVAIAYSSTIENAIGGSADDTITGNSVNNVIEGNQGNDTIDGGAGSDTAVFNGAYANYTIASNNGLLTVTANTGTDGIDTVSNVEFLEFSDLTYDVALQTTNATAAGGAIAAAVAGAAQQAGGGGGGGGGGAGAGGGGGGGGGGAFGGGYSAIFGAGLAERDLEKQRAQWELGRALEYISRHPELGLGHLISDSSSSSSSPVSYGDKVDMALTYVADQKSALAKIATALYEGSSLMQSHAFASVQQINTSLEATAISNQIQSSLESGSQVQLASIGTVSQQEVSFLLK